MHIREIELLRLELELRFPLRTSAGEHRHRPLVILRVTTDVGEGVGECCALEEPTYTEEYADGAEAVLRSHLVPRLIDAAGDLTTAEAMALLSSVRGHAMAKAGLEMALLDAELRASSRSLGDFLGATRSSIPAGANVSLGSPDAVAAAIEAVVSDGYRRVKVKIAPGYDVEVLRLARQSFPDVALSADANGAYELSNPAHRDALDAMDELGLTCIEQPLAPGELVQSAALCARLETPVILDESIASRADFDNATAMAALDGVSIKPARVGGLLVAKAMHDRALALGLSCSIGGMLESGIARAASIALGALPGFDLPGDLGASNRYFEPDLTDAHRLEDGALVVPLGSGLGVRLDEAELARATTHSEHFTNSR
jgi:O-succinylbenzoate synthase